MTLGDKLRRGSVDSNGFNTIRLLAALLVIFSHSFPIVNGSDAAEPLFIMTGGQATLGWIAVGAFFVISGLLISNSFANSADILSFTRKRFFRIMPALFVVCVAAVLLLGPALTVLPLKQYFAGAWDFMANAIFLPHDFALPGVFSNHPVRAVNGSLWSLKFEVACYIAAAVMLAVTRNTIFLVAGAWIASFFLSGVLNEGRDQSGVLFYLGMTSSLFRFFGAGMVFFVLRDSIPMRASYAWACCAITIGSILTPFFNDVAASLGAYSLVVCGYSCPAWFRQITAKGDLSYGTYLYAFPIQQALVPISLSSAFLNILFALPLTLLAALGSWILVEKPALSLAKKSQRNRARPRAHCVSGAPLEPPSMISNDVNP